LWRLIKAFYTGRFQAVTAAVYLVMGWMGVFFIGAVNSILGTGMIVWLGIGGLAYSLGVVPFLWEQIPFNHAIWHLFVIAGTTCHYLGILFHVLPAT
jgi:hemolysin III